MKALLPAVLLALFGCAAVQRPFPQDPSLASQLPALRVEEVARLIPEKVSGRDAWAEDLLAALEALGQPPQPEAVCAALAVIEQESNFRADPPVPGLARIARQRLESYAAKLGPLAGPALRELLQGKAIGRDETFEQQLAAVKTERDLDRLFRDLLAYHRAAYPKSYAVAEILGKLFGSRKLEDLNPITTAGAMQVSVRYATELAQKSRALTPEQVRDELYTRRGGVFYGTARLLGYPTRYPEMLFRFADYNAGVYASRNAALQAHLARLTGVALALDGDLLAYREDGQPLDRDSETLKAALRWRELRAPELSERELRRDFLREKELGFEETETYRRLTASRAGGAAAASYARLPEVTLRSPKLQAERSTAWFARSVERRYQGCLRRAVHPSS